jgi:hypothetical protein
VEVAEEVKAVSEWHHRMTHEGLDQKEQRYNMDHLVEGAKVYFYRPPSVLDVVKKTRKVKHIDHYVGPAVIIKKIGSRSFQISYTNPLTGTTQLLQRDAGMIILTKEWLSPSLVPSENRVHSQEASRRHGASGWRDGHHDGLHGCQGLVCC